MHGRAFYDAVGDALAGFLAPSLRGFEVYRSSHNLKLWYGPDGREHYEVQILKHGRKVGLEIGFHAEHTDPDRNQAAIDKLMTAERKWRKSLGAQPEAGPCLGGRTPPAWRRLSEFWDGADGGDDPDMAIDAAERLAAYVAALEPIRS